MEHEPVLIPNFTLLIQLGIFFATYFVLRGFVFGPYLNLLKVRREKTLGLKEEAIKAKEQAEKLRADYDVFMKNERKRIHTWADTERKAIEEEERGIVSAARATAGEELQAVRATIQNEAARVRKQLAPLASEYSSRLVSKLVGRDISVGKLALDHGSMNEDSDSRVPT